VEPRGPAPMPPPGETRDTSDEQGSRRPGVRGGGPPESSTRPRMAAGVGQAEPPSPPGSSGAQPGPPWSGQRRGCQRSGGRRADLAARLEAGTGFGVSRRRASRRRWRACGRAEAEEVYAPAGRRPPLRNRQAVSELPGAAVPRWSRRGACVRKARTRGLVRGGARIPLTDRRGSAGGQGASDVEALVEAVRPAPRGTRTPRTGGPLGPVRRRRGEACKRAPGPPRGENLAAIGKGHPPRPPSSRH